MGMRLQSLKAGCGPAAAANALSALGKTVDQEELARRAKTDADGTTPAGIRRALRWAGHETSEYKGSKGPGPREFLYYCLTHGHPMILCVDDWEHYVTAYALSADRIFVVDPADGNLILSYLWDELEERWANESKRKPFYAIVLEVP